MTFDKTRRNATVFILNQGQTPITVDVTLIDRMMMTDGQIVPADFAASHPEMAATLAKVRSAKAYVQISPRRVALDPGRGQNIRLRLSDFPADAGEFRSHLTVTTIPPRDSGTTAEEVAGGAGQNQLRFKINAVYGVSIPVIIRNETPQVSASLSNLRIETAVNGAGQRVPVLALDLARTGGSSLYGNLEVRPVGAKKGSDPIGVARGVGVYPEVDHRVVRVPLTRAPNAGEALEVTFTDDDTSPGKVLAKSTL